MTKILRPLTAVSAAFKLTDETVIGRIVGYNNGHFAAMADSNAQSAFHLSTALKALPDDEAESQLEILASHEMCYIVQDKFGYKSLHSRDEVSALPPDEYGLWPLPPFLSLKLQQSGAWGEFGRLPGESAEDYLQRVVAISRAIQREAVTADVANAPAHVTALGTGGTVDPILVPLRIDRLAAVIEKLETMGVNRERMAQLLGYLIEPPAYYPALSLLPPVDLKHEGGNYWNSISVQRFATDTAQHWVDTVFLDKR